MKALLVSLITAVALAPLMAQAGPVVTTKTGKIEGVTADGIESFKGIPFAAPPVGQLRWRAPQPVKRWQGIRQADAFGADCMQAPFKYDDAPLTVKPSEDCLFVNVWRPEGAVDKKRPVIVWIYGGGFINGGTSPAIYDGSAFAKGGAIFVSFNYRVGRFGFFAHPELTRTNADKGLLGNYGYMDQIAALKWVKANIAAFGGDPKQVTIFGESAGGGSVITLMTSPLSKGLFHRAIIQSGGGRGPLMGPRQLSKDVPNAPSAENLGVTFAKRMGIQTTGADSLAALRALPADKITDGLNLGAWSPDASGPMIDGKLVVESPEAAYRAGRYAKVPVMVGATSGDLGYAGAKTKEDLFGQFGTNAAEAQTAYDPDGSKTLERLNTEVGMDRQMIEPARFIAATLAQQGVKSWHYRFSYTATPKRASSPNGAPHASEIPFVMDTVTARYGADATAQDQATAKVAHAYWLNFAKTGNPNGSGADAKPLPVWPIYEPAKDILLDISPDGLAVPQSDFWKARLDVTAKAAETVK